MRAPSIHARRQPRLALRSRVALCALLALGSGCGAFADAVDDDGGSIEERADLIFSPNQWIQQGQTKQFQISFDPPPPWENEPAGFKHLTRFDFVEADDENAVLSDMEIWGASYDGARTVTATLEADADAETETLRRLVIEIAWEKSGQSQQTYAGADTFWVLPLYSTSGGGG